MIEAICEKHKCDLNQHPSLNEILESDGWARKEVLDYSEKILHLPNCWLPSSKHREI